VQQPRKGYNIDEEKALLIRNLATGQLSLIIEPQLFIPKPEEQIEKVQDKIRLESYHVAVVKDNQQGSMRFVNGPTTFFLEPYCELLTQYWSTGLHKDLRNLEIRLFDTRPHFMWYDFAGRTRDNVELIIGVTFFWGLEDVKDLVSNTSDPPGDLCSHARSVIIQAISRLSLEEFLASFNQVVEQAVLGTKTPSVSDPSEKKDDVKDGKKFRGLPLEDDFYSSRGLYLTSVEVRSIICKDSRTQDVLQEMIQEQTNRINRLQKQESENEVNLRQIHGKMESQKCEADLINVQIEQSQKEGSLIGLKEAARVRSFLKNLSDVVKNPDDRIGLFNTLRKSDAIAHLSSGKGVKMVFAPQNADLRVATR